MVGGGAVPFFCWGLVRSVERYFPQQLPSSSTPKCSTTPFGPWGTSIPMWRGGTHSRLRCVNVWCVPPSHPVFIFLSSPQTVRLVEGMFAAPSGKAVSLFVGTLKVLLGTALEEEDALDHHRPEHNLHSLTMFHPIMEYYNHYPCSQSHNMFRHSII